MADAVVESKGGVPVVAYVKDEGEGVTMKDVIKQTERENAEKLAKIRAERQARQEAWEKEQAEREARRAALESGEGKPAGKKPLRKKPEPKAEAVEEAPKAEESENE